MNNGSDSDSTFVSPPVRPVGYGLADEIEMVMDSSS